MSMTIRREILFSWYVRYSRIRLSERPKANHGLEYIRDFCAKRNGSFPTPRDYSEAYPLRPEWTNNYFTGVLEYMRLATQYGILNEQISSLEGFRLQYIPQYMVQQDNWHRPLAKPAYTAENEQQSHKRQIANLDNVDQAMKNYLSTKNAIPGSLVGFPESSDDQGAQVSEAIEAMMQTAGSAEEMELKKRDGPSENAGHELLTLGKA